MDSFSQIAPDLVEVASSATAVMVGIIGLGILISLLALLFMGVAK